MTVCFLITNKSKRKEKEKQKTGHFLRMYCQDFIYKVMFESMMKLNQRKVSLLMMVMLTLGIRTPVHVT